MDAKADSHTIHSFKNLMVLLINFQIYKSLNSFPDLLGCNLKSAYLVGLYRGTIFRIRIRQLAFNSPLFVTIASHYD